jgi:Flp pilus assembly protein TadG
MARALVAAGGRGRTRGRRRSGIAVVEFAFVAVALMILVLGMFEMARGLQVRQILTDAARKGCRTGILRQYGNTDITNDATNIMRDNGFDATAFNPPTIGSVTITVTDPNGNTLSDALDAPPGSTISVQVTIPSDTIRWTAAVWLTDSTMVSDLVVMMKQ